MQKLIIENMFVSNEWIVACMGYPNELVPRLVHALYAKKRNVTGIGSTHLAVPMHQSLPNQSIRQHNLCRRPKNASQKALIPTMIKTRLGCSSA